jgi:hypothetical protein
MSSILTFFSLQPVEFQSLINSFYFNSLQEKEEKSNSCTNSRVELYLKMGFDHRAGHCRPLIHTAVSFASFFSPHPVESV